MLTCLTKAPQPLDQLEKATGLPAGKVLEALQVLEGMGLARPCPGGGILPGLKGRKRPVS